MKAKTQEEIFEQLKQLQETLPLDLKKKVGNVLFGNDAYVVKLQKAKTREPNTSWEDRLYQMVQSWVNSSDADEAKYFKKNKEIIQKIAKEFPAVLQPPIGKKAYRGTQIKIDSLKNAFLKKRFKVVRLAGREMFYFKNLEYNPKRDSQSWTMSPKVATSFGGNGPDRVQVFYAAKVNKDFIFNPKFLNIIFNGREDEVVRVAKKGTFEALVDIDVVINNWNIQPDENFIHLVPSAKPFFAKIVARHNKTAGKYHLPEAKDIVELMQLYKAGKVDFLMDFDKLYSQAAKNYAKSLKKKK